VCLAENGLVRYNTTTGKEDNFYLSKMTTFTGKTMTAEHMQPACNGVDVDDKYVYVAYGSFGMHILDKETFKEVAYYYNKEGKSANYVKAVKYGDGYRTIYIAYGENGLNICRVKE